MDVKKIHLPAVKFASVDRVLIPARRYTTVLKRKVREMYYIVNFIYCFLSLPVWIQAG